jgi:hypothetical protein
MDGIDVMNKCRKNDPKKRNSYSVLQSVNVGTLLIQCHVGEASSSVEDWRRDRGSTVLEGRDTTREAIGTWRPERGNPVRRKR